ncbi:MAG: uracil-xanthine permease [Clostridia bacterium]|nr:uracil-xanthine permease [Clostridia bacterium]
MEKMKYGVHDRPPFWQNLAFAMQQVLAIVAATILVPLIADPSGTYLSQSAALIGAGVGTIIYLCLTQFKSPVFLGSSFAYIAPLSTAITFGYLGVFLGSIFAGLTYVVIAIIIHFVGTNWINRLMPPIIIGPVVALIGFDLAASAVSNVMNTSGGMENYNLISIAIGLITFFVVVLVSVKAKGGIKMFPFIIGIVAGYALACIITLIGIWANVPYMQIVDFSVYEKVTHFENWLPNLIIVGMFKEGAAHISSFSDVFTVFIAFVPIALVSFAEHIADHKNLGSIIGKDLTKDPGLTRTLLGDGLGSVAGAAFGGVPTTTYGESIGCVALSKNASTRTILTTSVICIIISFFYPIIVFISSIPSCVIGGVSIALYGFISVSGLRMFKEIDLNDSRNLFVVASIFITGIGGMFLNFGSIKISNIACALVVGILTNVLLTPRNKKQQGQNDISQSRELLESEDTIEPKSKRKKQAEPENKE